MDDGILWSCVCVCVDVFVCGCANVRVGVLVGLDAGLEAIGDRVADLSEGYISRVSRVRKAALHGNAF